MIQEFVILFDIKGKSGSIVDPYYPCINYVYSVCTEDDEKPINKKYKIDVSMVHDSEYFNEISGSMDVVYSFGGGEENYNNIDYELVRDEHKYLCSCLCRYSKDLISMKIKHKKISMGNYHGFKTDIPW